MHAHAFDFVAQAREYLPVPASVVEIGSRDVNGSVRELFVGAAYCGVDLIAGRGVDLVADGATFTRAETADLVLSCETFEHAAAWTEILDRMIELARVGGAVIVTAAGPTRSPHSAVDGGPLREGEYYAGVSLDALRARAEARGLHVLQAIDRPDRGDVYLLGVRR